ncbi:DUF4838 domain-containing protein [bacterium]|nr:DUF4838 domain-containing protein [bacterium]
MTSSVVLVVLLAAGCGGLPAGRGAGDGRYGGQVYIATNASKSVTANAEELAGWLGKITGEPFVVTTNAAPGELSGVFLARTDSPLVPAAWRQRLESRRSMEAYLLRSEGSSRLWIVGQTDLAIQHGIYDYLDRLGCRWFFPNDHWTIIPSLKSIAVKIHRVEAPAYRYRDFGGTGGFGGSLVLDPERKLQARWMKWEARNRLGGVMPLSGHTGEAFNTAHKQQLEAHPEYLAEIGGKRQPWNEITKLCGSNPEVRRLYIDWTLERFGRVYESDPEGTRAWGVSVEPADGSGQCECAQCNKIGDGSSTDKVFFLANEAAKALAAKYPGKKASLLAYNDHAMVPTIPLEPNIVVWVTPYGFNRTGLSGDELLAAWGEKCDALGLYDYWSIPDWSNCLPDLSYRETVPAKLRHWQQNAVVAFCGESSYSAGNVGLVWYVASRVMWNPSADVDALLEDFYTRSFGPAAPPMRRLLERWGQGFLLVSQELGSSFRDLEEARQLAPDDAVRARIDDFVLYLQYLRRWFEYQETKVYRPPAKDPARRELDQQQQAQDHAATTDALLRYCWRVYDSAMVHSYRMAMLVMHRYERGDVSKELIARWPFYDQQAEIWKTIKPVTDAEIDQFVAAGVRQFEPADYEARTYSETVVPLVRPDKSWKPSPEWVQGPPLACEQECLFWVPAGVPQIEIMFTTGRVSDSSDRITVTAPNGKVVFEQRFPSGTPWQTLAIPTPVSGTYRMNIFDPKVSFGLRVPKNLPFVLKGGFISTSQSPKVYFFVPPGLKRFVLYGDGAIPFYVYDPNGVARQPLVNQFIVLDTPAGMDGKVWSLSGFKGWTPLRGINFPSLFAFSPEGMMVPAELKPSAKKRD